MQSFDGNSGFNESPALPGNEFPGETASGLPV
jgi:hypothetical protein